MTIADRIPAQPSLGHFAESLKAPEAGISVYWLGQAGFYIITKNNIRIAIDPYLTWYCDRVVGFRRIMPPVMDASAFDCDVLLLSHAHEDHCDMDLLASMEEHGSCAAVLATSDCCKRIGNMKLRVSSFNTGDMYEKDGVRIIAVPCDHGKNTPYATGYMVQAEDLTVYFAGDTSLNPSVIKAASDYAPDLALLPVNGAYGNLSAPEAGKMAEEIGCKYMIPCHYWMFVEHGAFPIDLKNNEKELCPDVEVLWVMQGEGITLQSGEMKE